jgi:hypothetical protein
MKKYIARVVLGLMFIAIIIESTSLISSLPQDQSASLSSPAAQFSPIVTYTIPEPQTPMQTEPVRDNPDTLLPASTPMTDSGPVENPNSPTAIAIPVNGNYMSTVGDNSAPSSLHQAQEPFDSLPTLVPGIGYVQYDEPLPDGDENVSDFQRASVLPVPTLPPQDFVEIFHQNQVYVYNTTAISFRLINPHMDIEFNVTPMMSVDTKWIPNRDIQKPLGAPDGKILSVARPDQNSWFRITVLDKGNNGTIVDKNGYSGIYDLTTSKEIHIREPGYYQIQLDGGYIVAETRILVPRKGNII